MKVTVDTSHDSHEDIKKVIRMLQNLVGDSQEIFTNQLQSSETSISPIANIFGDTASAPAASSEETVQAAASQAEEMPQSTEDLFAELFSDEELKKMDVKKESEEEEESEEELKPKSKDKKYGVELY